MIQRYYDTTVLLYIGHAKACSHPVHTLFTSCAHPVHTLSTLCAHPHLHLQARLAREAGMPGATVLRFDDTNPTAEKQEYIDSITENLRLLLTTYYPAITILPLLLYYLYYYTNFTTILPNPMDPGASTPHAHFETGAPRTLDDIARPHARLLYYYLSTTILLYHTTILLVYYYYTAILLLYYYYTTLL